MKLIATIALAVMLGAWACNAIAATASGSFTYDFTNDVPCSATVTKDCIDHFTIFDVTAAPSNIVLSTVVAPNTGTASTSVPFNFKVGAPYGTRKWAVTATAKDSAGNFTSSDPAAPQAQATVTVRPGAPASFVVNLQ